MYLCDLRTLTTHFLRLKIYYGQDQRCHILTNTSKVKVMGQTLLFPGDLEFRPLIRFHLVDTAKDSPHSTMFDSSFYCRPPETVSKRPLLLLLLVVLVINSLFSRNFVLLWKFCLRNFAHAGVAQPYGTLVDSNFATILPCFCYPFVVYCSFLTSRGLNPDNTKHRVTSGKEK